MRKIKPKATARQERTPPTAALSLTASTPGVQQSRTILAQGSPSIGEFTLNTPVHATIGGPAMNKKRRAKLTDVELIRSLAKKRGWTDDKLRKMSTERVTIFLRDDLIKLEGEEYRERSRSTYRRAQGRRC